MPDSASRVGDSCLCPSRYIRIGSHAVRRHTGLLITSQESTVQKRRPTQRGQGMTEYIIVVALVAVSAIAVYQMFGQVVRSQTAAMAKELAGEDGSEESRMAQTAAEAAAAQTAAKTLKSFTGNAGGGQ